MEFLREFGSVGAKMRRMRDFTKHYILPFDTHQQARQTPTLMAFSQSLDRVLLSLKKKVMKIPRRVLEARASRRGEVILESQLYTTYISPLELLSVARLEVFPEVCTLYEFYAFAVEHNRGTPVPTSAQILSQMYCFLRDSRQAPNYRDLLAIFMASIKPFHSVLDSFLACGEALDPCNEFFVEKSTFFDRGESYVPVFITKYAKQIKEIGFMFNLLGLGHGNNCVLAPASTTVESTISSIPECEHDTSMDCEPTPNSLLLRKQRSIDDVIRESQNDIGVTFRSAACSIEYTTNAMNEKPTKCFASNESEDNADEMLNETDIKRLVDAMFCASVEGSYTRTGAAAVATMDREWHMRRHIHAVKNYLLMEAGDFSSALCERIFRIHSEFADYQCMLDETCRECFWEDECRKNLSFTVADTERHPLDSIKYLDFLSLTYSVGNGKDPITHVLFTRENMKKYEMMWKFLLRIKRALFLLKEAWVSTKRVVPRDLATVGTVPPESEARKARIAMGFMDRLLKDVEVYFYQEALCAPWGVFSSSLDSASNIEDLTRCHSAFVDEMLARCFITKKYAPIARMFTTLIDTAIKFTYAYEEGELRWKPLDDKFSETARTLYEVLSKVSEGKTRYDLSLAQLLHVLGLVGWKPH